MKTDSAVFLDVMSDVLLNVSATMHTLRGDMHSGGRAVCDEIVRALNNHGIEGYLLDYFRESMLSPASLYVAKDSKHTHESDPHRPCRACIDERDGPISP